MDRAASIPCLAGAAGRMMGALMATPATANVASASSVPVPKHLHGTVHGRVCWQRQTDRQERKPARESNGQELPHRSPRWQAAAAYSASNIAAPGRSTRLNTTWSHIKALEAAPRLQQNSAGAPRLIGTGTATSLSSRWGCGISQCRRRRHRSWWPESPLATTAISLLTQCEQPHRSAIAIPFKCFVTRIPRCYKDARESPVRPESSQLLFCSVLLGGRAGDLANKECESESSVTHRHSCVWTGG
jgi:hypothetical protein